MSNTFFVHLPSNSTDYPDNGPNKFRVRLPKPIYFNGSWVAGLHSISYAYSWPSTIGTLDDQSISIHFTLPNDRQRVLHVPIPKASHTKVEKLRDFLAASFKHQSESVESQAKSGYRFVGDPRLDISPPKTPPQSPPTINLKRKRSIRSPSPITRDLSSPPLHGNNERTVSPPPVSPPKSPSPQQTRSESQTSVLVESGIPSSTTDEKKDLEPTLNDQEKQKRSSIIDQLFGRKPEPGEKNRADQFLATLFGEEYDNKEDKKPSFEQLRQIIDGVELQYHKDFDRFKTIFKDPHIDFISFSSQLGYVLGFENPHRVVNNEIAKYGCDLRGGFSSFAVYAKGLTENMIIGNSLSSLLRVVSVMGAIPGEYTEKIYDSPIYARVLPKEVSEIEIELRTMDNGRLLPFSYGTLMVVLIFKKVINF